MHAINAYTHFSPSVQEHVAGAAEHISSLWKAHSSPLQYQAVIDRCKTTVDYETVGDQALINVNPVNCHRRCSRVSHSHSQLLIHGWCRHSQRLYCMIAGDSYTFCFQTLA